MDLRHLWFISSNLLTGESTIKTIFRQRFKSRQGSIFRTFLNDDSRRAWMRAVALLAIFTLNFSSKMISLHVSPPHREMILNLRHLWFISSNLVTGEPTVKTIFCQRFKSQQGYIIKTFLNDYSRRAWWWILVGIWNIDEKWVLLWVLRLLN